MQFYTILSAFLCLSSSLITILNIYSNSIWEKCRVCVLHGGIGWCKIAYFYQSSIAAPANQLCNFTNVLIIKLCLASHLMVKPNAMYTGITICSIPSALYMVQAKVLSKTLQWNLLVAVYWHACIACCFIAHYLSNEAFY